MPVPETHLREIARWCEQLRHQDGEWRLYWPDRNTRWHLLDDIPPTTSPGPLLTAIDEPNRAFW